MCVVFAFACSAGGCGAAAGPRASAESASAPTTTETRKQPDAVLVELDVQLADEVSIENLRTAIRRSPALALDPASVAPGARRLLLRFEATHPTEAGASLERTMSLTGFTNGGDCQIFKLAPKLTKPGGKKANAADVEELTTAGVHEMVVKLEGLTPKIGPNATCLATGP